MAKFSSKDSTVVALIFRPLIHFGLIFVCGARWTSTASFFCMWIPCWPCTVCWKDCSSIELFWHPRQKSVTNVFIFAFSVLSIDLYVCPYDTTIVTTVLIIIPLFSSVQSLSLVWLFATPWIAYPCSKFWNQQLWILSSLFFSVIVLALLGPHMNFKISSSISAKKTAKYLTRVVLSL